jgi:hypothetical protein
MSTTTYGSFPGVRAEVIGGGVNGVIVGEEQKIVLFGRGDTSGADSAEYNQPTRITTRVDANVKFGANTELSHAIAGALQNGANSEFIYGVMPEEITVSAELVAGGSGQLSNYPIVEDKSLIVVNDVSGTTPQEQTVEFVYETPPNSPTGSDTVNINPLTGEVEASDSNDYEVDYNYLDWASALDAADPVLQFNETGVYCTVSDADAVTEQLSTKLDELRPEYKLIRGVAPAQPNGTNADGEPVIDVDTYTNALEDDALYLAGPTRLDGQAPLTLIGGIAGMFAGHPLTDPVYGDRVRGYDQLIQQLNRSEESTLRSSYVIPIADQGIAGEGDIYLNDNLSTSTLEDWERDYHRRRIVDQVLLIGRNIGEQAVNQRLTEELMKFTEQVMLDEIEELANAGLLEGSSEQAPNASGGGATDDDDEEVPYYVDVTRSATDELSVAIGITPIGIAKRVDETIVVSDAGATA